MQILRYGHTAKNLQKQKILSKTFIETNKTVTEQFLMMQNTQISQRQGCGVGGKISDYNSDSLT